MSGFTYWESGDSVQHEFANDQPLSVEQAQVLATKEVAERLQEISSTPKDVLHFLETHAVLVEMKSEKK